MRRRSLRVVYLRAEPGGRFAAKIRGIMQQMEASGVVRARQVPGGPHSPS